IDVLQARLVRTGNDALKDGFARFESDVPKIETFQIDDIEYVIDQAPRAPRAERLLERWKAADTVGRARHDLTVGHSKVDGQPRHRGSDLGKPAGPVVSLARAELDRTVVQPGDDPIAVELDLVEPLFPPGSAVRSATKRGFKGLRDVRTGGARRLAE